MNQFYLYDEDKLFAGIELRSKQYDEEMQEVVYEDGTFIRPEDGMYKAKFDGGKWIETITDEELEKLNNIIVEPTLKDRVDTLEGAVVEIMETTL